MYAKASGLGVVSSLPSAASFSLSSYLSVTYYHRHRHHRYQHHHCQHHHRHHHHQHNHIMATGASFTGREYEKDTRWIDVDRYALAHLDQDNPYQTALQYAKDTPTKEGLPNIEVSTLQGKFLATQCQLINAKHILEVGTLGGYSAIWMASTAADVKVTTIEVDPKHKAVAERVFENAGLQDQIDVRLGAASDVLPKIRAEIEASTRPAFDLIFIDADKPSNRAYFNEAIQMARSRACIIVDNVVRRGSLASESLAKTDEKVKGSREVVEAVGRDRRVLQSTLLQTVGEKNYDGFLICVVR